MRFHITKFVRRQTLASEFSCWNISDEELLRRVEEGFPNAVTGYREGVLLVPINPEGFLSSVTQLVPGQALVGRYRARQKGETPRKSTYSPFAKKMPAKRVDVILYSHAVLLEKMEHETSAEYEIVSVNAAPTADPMPIPTGALIANHLELSGGTATKMTDTEFVKLLRESVEFWSDKALAPPEDLEIERDSIIEAKSSLGHIADIEKYESVNRFFEQISYIFQNKDYETLENEHLGELLRAWK